MEKEESLQRGIYNDHDIHQDYNLSTNPKKQWAAETMITGSQLSSVAPQPYHLAFKYSIYSSTTVQGFVGQEQATILLFKCCVDVIPLTKVVIQESVGSIHNF